MRNETTNKLLTVDEFCDMAEAGAFACEARFELIDGQIIEMTARGNRHVGCVDRAAIFFVEAFGRRAQVSIQNPVELNLYNMPQPDVTVLKPCADFYETQRHKPEDILFVVEVSDSTLRTDRKIKLPRYALNGVPEVWIEDLRHNVLLVHREPKDNIYRVCFTRQRGESISPLAFPDSVFQIEDLLG